MSAHARILAEQRELWGTAPRDWAQLAERENEPLFRRVMDAASVQSGTRLLDVGCGSGLLCELAAARGARVAGIDITPQLLAIARERVPDGDLRDGDMGALPYPDASFDAVTGVNAFQFAPDPARAFAEAARVLRPGGRLVAAVFAEPERNDGTVLHLAMKQLIAAVEGEDDGYAPYALSTSEGMRTALTGAGLTPHDEAEVPVDWRYADEQTALRSLFASAGGARAIRAAGRDRVQAALIAAMRQFKGEDGVVTMHNLFRYVVAEAPR